MNLAMKILLFFGDLVLPLGLGYWLARRGKIGRAFFDRLLVVAIVTLAPALGLLSFWKIRLTLSLVWLPILGVVMQMAPGAIGMAIGRRRFECPLEEGSFVISTILSNRGVAGMILVYILYGEQGYAWCRLVMLFAAVTVYFFCFPLAGYYHAKANAGASGRPSIARIIFSRNQAPALGVIAGFALNLCGVPRPEILETAFHPIMHLCVWCFVVPTGYAINFAELRKYLKDSVQLLIVKFVVTPVVILPLAWLVGLRGPVFWVVAILSFSPAAINSVVTARLHKLNVHVATAGFVLTLAVYLLVVAPLVLILASLFG